MNSLQNNEIQPSREIVYQKAEFSRMAQNIEIYKNRWCVVTKKDEQGRLRAESSFIGMICSIWDDNITWRKAGEQIAKDAAESMKANLELLSPETVDFMGYQTIRDHYEGTITKLQVTNSEPLALDEITEKISKLDVLFQKLMGPHFPSSIIINEETRLKTMDPAAALKELIKMKVENDAVYPYLINAGIVDAIAEKARDEVLEAGAKEILIGDDPFKKADDSLGDVIAKHQKLQNHLKQYFGYQDESLQKAIHDLRSKQTAFGEAGILLQNLRQAEDLPHAIATSKQLMNLIKNYKEKMPNAIGELETLSKEAVSKELLKQVDHISQNLEAAISTDDIQKMEAAYQAATDTLPDLVGLGHQLTLEPSRKLRENLSRVGHALTEAYTKRQQLREEMLELQGQAIEEQEIYIAQYTPFIEALAVASTEWQKFEHDPRSIPHAPIRLMQHILEYYDKLPTLSRDQKEDEYAKIKLEYAHIDPALNFGDRLIGPLQEDGTFDCQLLIRRLLVYKNTVDRKVSNYDRLASEGGIKRLGNETEADYKLLMEQISPWKKAIIPAIAKRIKTLEAEKKKLLAQLLPKKVASEQGLFGAFKSVAQQMKVATQEAATAIQEIGGPSERDKINAAIGKIDAKIKTLDDYSKSIDKPVDQNNGISMARTLQEVVKRLPLDAFDLKDVETLTRINNETPEGFSTLSLKDQLKMQAQLTLGASAEEIENLMEQSADYKRDTKYIPAIRALGNALALLSQLQAEEA